ncbi:MAG TPA: hypothetical protein VM557_00920 [Thermoanaerobaculia bacterium]|nr:hypothetical protein [Thermoanaerobaculia bacterium]
MRPGRLIVVCLTLVLVVSLSGCKLKKAMDEAQISESLSDIGTTDLMEATANDTYEGPEDGKLTDAQIQMYLKVREQEKKIAQIARKEAEAHAKKAKASGEKSLAGAIAGFKALGSVADMFTADIRAAHELGYNTAEYQWIKGKVLEASGSVLQDQMNESINAMMTQGHNELKKQYDETTDEQAKAALKTMLDQYEQNRKEMEAQQQADLDPAVGHNRQLLAKYENALNAIAQELAKFEENPGDAEKSVQEWQQKLNEQANAPTQ